MVLTLNHALGTLSIVIQQLFNKINMCQHHPTAAVSAETKFVQGISVVVYGGVVVSRGDGLVVPKVVRERE